MIGSHLLPPGTIPQGSPSGSADTGTPSRGDAGVAWVERGARLSYLLQVSVYALIVVCYPSMGAVGARTARLVVPVVPGCTRGGCTVVVYARYILPGTPQHRGGGPAVLATRLDTTFWSKLAKIGRILAKFV